MDEDIVFFGFGSMHTLGDGDHKPSTLRRLRSTSAAFCIAMEQTEEPEPNPIGFAIPTHQ